MATKKKDITLTYPLEIEDKRVLQLADYAVKHGLVDSEADFWDKIRFAKTSITKVRSGVQAFTRQQIKLAALLTGANINWIMDIEKDQWRNKGKAKTGLQLLREAQAVIEQELTKKKAPQRPEMLN